MRILRALGLLAALLSFSAPACKSRLVPPPGAAALPPSILPVVSTVPKGQLGRFRQAVVASANPLASHEGALILAEGGTALDAAVTTALVLGVVEPHSAGIGGGGFLLHYDASSGAVSALDYRERAPRRAFRDLYQRDGGVQQRLAVDGHLAVGVPGTVAGLFEAHAKFGRLPWSRLVEPAARIAEGGYEVQPRVAAVLRLREKVLRRYPASVKEFFPDGRVPKAGERLRHPELAATLRAIGDTGPAPFYTGTIASRIAEEVARGGGLLDAQDLRDYQPLWREPVRGEVHGVEVFSMPPPSSGGLHVVQMLQMLQGDPLATLAPDARWHLLIEAMRRAYADRAEFLGDPDFVQVPRGGLLDARYLAERRRSIDPARATPSSSVRAGDARKYESPSTTHLSVLDGAGNAVSLTQSINYGMGAGVVVPGTGILLNDTMDDFSVAPGTANAYGLLGGEANAVAARKTPLSSMTPTLVLRDGKLWLALGSPGGATIISTVLNVLINRVVLGLELAQAVNAARIHHQWMPDVVLFERSGPGADDALAAQLRARGHRVTRSDSLGNVQAVELGADGTRYGVSDPRVDGAVSGF